MYAKQPSNCFGEDESSELLQELLHILQTDESSNVRAEAAKALGRFVLRGEMGDLRDEQVEMIYETLLNTINISQEDSEVRRFAIESISNCTRDDIPNIIKAAYNDADPNMRLSAIVAMGRSCDERWENEILEELSSSDDDMRIAAIQSAGEVQIASAVRPIIKNIEDGERHEQEIAIWSLGEIGGKEAVRTLESLLEGAENADDADLIERIDDAMGNASLANGDFMMIDMPDFDD